ncbi:MAG: orotate phosphoribosyltransferase [Betaproteobacteria bacterium TMED156]|nr:MAG: orotate phosphoribosyltransferase [Betaproteobacteria bacterium TMED156]
MKNISTDKFNLSNDFLTFALTNNILRFGKFKTKAGRLSPYFFDMGKFSNSKLLTKLGEFYSKKIQMLAKSDLCDPECLFGPAYKGIPLICSTAIAMRENKSINFAYNRKEEKKHGEGGIIVGNVAKKNVFILDDVISAGLSITQSIKLIQEEGGVPICAIVALDRMERPTDSEEKKLISSKEITKKTGVPVFSISNVLELKENLSNKKTPESKQQLLSLQNYLKKWGNKFDN